MDTLISEAPLPTGLTTTLSHFFSFLPGECERARARARAFLEHASSRQLGTQLLPLTWSWAK